jgi:hypothetical protein
MELLAALDPYAVAATTMVLTLAVCVASLVLLRDRESAPPRFVTWKVWCGERGGRRAVVDFVERVQTGLRLREVRGCSLRGDGQRCSEECSGLATADVRADTGPAEPEKLPFAP